MYVCETLPRKSLTWINDLRQRKVEYSRMQILSIDLDRTLEDTLICELGVIVCHAADLAEACDQISTEDFSVILYNITPETYEHKLLQKLVGLSLISTRIILLGGPDQLAPELNLKDLGVELSPACSATELVRKIQHTTGNQPYVDGS